MNKLVNKRLNKYTIYIDGKQVDFKQHQLGLKNLKNHNWKRKVHSFANFESMYDFICDKCESKLYTNVIAHKVIINSGQHMKDNYRCLTDKESLVKDIIN